MIEKKIHYVWVGGKPKPDLVNICIENWKYMLPEYEIIEWNETNVDIAALSRECEFFKLCYQRSLWAFVSDYIRLKVLYDHGGIYLDTDVTVTRSLDPLLDNELFIGREDDKYINGAIIGSVRHSPVVGRILEFYQKKIMESDIYTIPRVITQVFQDNSCLTESAIILPKEYFYPYHYSEEFDPRYLTEKTFTIHWWGKSWMENDTHIFLRSKHTRGFGKVILYLSYYGKKIISGKFFKKW